MKRQREKVLSLINRLYPWAIVFLEFVYTGRRYFHYGKQFLNSDMSAEMVLANLLNKTGALFCSTDWFYSTEIRIIDAPIVHRLALILFPDWHIARTFSILISMLIILGSLAFLLYQAKNMKLLPWIAAVIFCPFSGLYCWILLIGCFYTFHIAFMFIIVGLILRLSRSDKLFTNKKTAVTLLWMFLLGLSAYFSGLCGIRRLLICTVPAFAASFLILLQPKNPTFYNSDNGERRFSRYWNFAGAAIALVFSATGYFVNEKIYSSLYTYRTYGSIAISDFSLTRLMDCFSSMTTVLGYKSGSILFSYSGLQSCVAIVIFSLICFVPIYYVTHKKEFTPQEAFIILFNYILLCVSVLSSVMSGRTDPRYLIPAVIFSFISIWIVLKHIAKQSSFFKIALKLTIPLILVIFFVKPDWSMYYHDHTNGIIEATNWLVENNYDNGYGTFWNGDIVTELSNGKIRVYVLDDSIRDNWKELMLYPWLQEKRNLEQRPEGSVFVLLAEEEYAANPSFLSGGKMVYNSNGYYVFHYDSANCLFESVNPIE